MTEKEKAQAGLLYKSTEEELKSELMRCKNLCAEYNRLMPSQSEERKALLKKNSWQDRRKFLDRAIVLVRLWL